MSPEQFEDITGIRKGTLEVIIGSPPCQTFSTIGVPKIKSLKNGDIETDPRNYLFNYFFNYISYYRPEIFLMENVPGMKTKYKGKLFDRLIDLVLGLGYEPHIQIINSVEFGVPQVRKRLILVGTKKGIKFKFHAPTHYCCEEKQVNIFTLDESKLQKATTVYDAISDLPKIYDGCREDELPYSKDTNLTNYQIMIRNKNSTVRNNICRMSNDRAKKVFSYMSQGSKYMDLPKNVRQILPFREDIFPDA
ncbi:hypothetical protein N752_25095 [Desulforamulus aquiferis]|nr:hypothetical protein N752_25095 [Desulforamulus aquiferis]